MLDSISKILEEMTLENNLFLQVLKMFMLNICKFPLGINFETAMLKR